MALSDPQSITIGANTRSAARTSVNPTGSVYSDVANGVTFTVSTLLNKRQRTVVRVDLEKIAGDPFVTTLNRKVAASAYLVLNAPLSGFTQAELKDLCLSVSTWMTAGSSANLIKAIGRES